MGYGFRVQASSIADWLLVGSGGKGYIGTTTSDF